MGKGLCITCKHRGYVKDDRGNECYWCGAMVEIELPSTHGPIVECSEFVEAKK